jgi:murein DD-endopeptidase MepM/ murein hydrolase activator NlpD
VQASLGGRLPAARDLPARPFPGAAEPNVETGVAGEDSSQLVMMPGSPQPQPRTGLPVKSSLLEGLFQRAASLFHAAGQHLHAAPPPRENSTIAARHPGLQFLAQQLSRIAHIGESENLLMARTEGTLGQGVGNLRNVMRSTGINPDAFARKIAGSEGVGGPEIPLDQVRIEGISDPNFSHAYLSASAVLDQLNGLSAAMDHVPLAAPVPVTSFDKSSGFGARVDPFTGRYAFHPGIDFAGPWGSVVHATAPGTVVFAGNRGGYGNMVEVDHGYGIHTRYGHLSTVSVRVGTYVGRGAGLGRVGSTGRSTGPHVHYEVWYDDVARNPNKFIEAGRHVL